MRLSLRERCLQAGLAEGHHRTGRQIVFTSVVGECPHFHGRNIPESIELSSPIKILISDVDMAMENKHSYMLPNFRNFFFKLTAWLNSFLQLVLIFLKFIS